MDMKMRRRTATLALKWKMRFSLLPTTPHLPLLQSTLTTLIPIHLPTLPTMRRTVWEAMATTITLIGALEAPFNNTMVEAVINNPMELL